MRRPLLLAIALAAVIASTLFAREVGASDATEFRTPDAGAACRVKRAELVCGSLGSEGSLALRATGAPRVLRELPWWDASTPVLHHFRQGGVTCSLRGKAILCHNHRATIRIDRAGFAVVL